MCIPQFLRAYGFWPNFLQPIRFSEKLWSRQLHTRDPRFTLISDKFQVRKHIEKQIGSDYLVPLLWHGESADEIPYNDLPSNFIIKTNHGCGCNIVVREKHKLDKKSAKLKLENWMQTNYCDDKFLGIAWAYKNIKAQIIIEASLDENGKLPVDYKFFCFSGRMEFFKMDFNRYENHMEAFFDRNCNRLELIEVGLKAYPAKIVFPTNIRDMIRVAESLSAEYDFMRIDLYSKDNKIFFGECTPYPGGVSARFEPESYDYIFGSKWQ